MCEMVVKRCHYVNQFIMFELAHFLLERPISNIGNFSINKTASSIYEATNKITSAKYSVKLAKIEGMNA